MVASTDHPTIMNSHHAATEDNKNDKESQGQNNRYKREGLNANSRDIDKERKPSSVHPTDLPQNVLVFEF